jgi:homocysteine S-methyltransferase
VGLDVVLQYSSRDKPLLAMQSELLGAHAMGVRSVLVVTGEVRLVGDYPDAAAIADVDSIGLVNAIARLNQGLDVGGQSIGRPTAFHVGVTVNPAAEDLDEEIRRFEHKVRAGAEYVISRPVFDAQTFLRFHRRIEGAHLPIVLGLRPLEGIVEAEYLANEVPGVYVSSEVRERMRRAPTDAAASAEGVAIASEVGQALRSHVQGVMIVPPIGRFQLGLDVLDRLG